MAEMGKIAVNTWDFRGKKQIIGTEKTANWQPNRKAKWCKMHVMLSKMSQKTNPQDCNLPLIASFNALFFARRGWRSDSVL